MFGGAGINSLSLHYMYYNGETTDFSQQMLKSIDKIWDEPVVVHLGNHLGNNKTLKKRELQIKEGGNSFVALDSWHTFLSEFKMSIEKVIEDNKALQDGGMNKII